MFRFITYIAKRCAHIYTTEIWQPAHIGEKSLRGFSYAVLRVISITITGIFATRAFARAAALSFTTLLSLGPLVALAVMVAGFVLKQNDPDTIANKLNAVIEVIAPQVNHYEDVRQHERRGQGYSGYYDSGTRAFAATTATDSGTAAATAAAMPSSTSTGETAQNNTGPTAPASENIQTSGTTQATEQAIASAAPETPPDATASTPPATASVESATTSGTNANTVAPETAFPSENKALGAAGAVNPERIDARKVRPDIVRLLNNFVTNARSGTIGGISAISLIVIVILLFGAIEDVFNDIWGVRRTRSWLTRIVFYWTILTLGTLLIFVIFGTFSAAAFTDFFKDKSILGMQMVSFVKVIMPVLTAVVGLGLLTLFYRFIPNTHVYWRAALAGAVTMCGLLVLNNMLAFAYFRRIEITRTLYGPIGIVPVLMLGLYVFWLIVLIGGQVSYAVQNVHFRNSQVAWTSLSHNTRERLTLLVLLTIARRFQACKPACTVSELSDNIKAPAQILNECLNRLIDLKLVSPVPPTARNEASSMFLYQPSRPLNRITLGDFKELFENMGETPASTLIDQVDPIGAHYHNAIMELNRNHLFSKTLEELFNEHPVDASHKKSSENK